MKALAYIRKMRKWLLVITYEVVGLLFADNIAGSAQHLLPRNFVFLGILIGLNAYLGVGLARIIREEKTQPLMDDAGKPI